MKKKLITILICSFFAITSVYGAGSGDSGGSDSGGGNEAGKLNKYRTAVNLINSAKKLEKKGKIEKAKKKYKKAYDRLVEANESKPSNPDILNYLGFTSRKLGNFEDAEVYYKLGLDVDPLHNGINEYLGELYFNTNRMELAQGRLDILKDCNCEEYQELKEIIEGTKKSKY